MLFSVQIDLKSLHHHYDYFTFSQNCCSVIDYTSQVRVEILLIFIPNGNKWKSITVWEEGKTHRKKKERKKHRGCTMVSYNCKLYIASNKGAETCKITDD